MVYYFVMNNTYFEKKKNMCQRSKSKGLVHIPTKRNIHMKYENSGTHCSKVIN